MTLFRIKGVKKVRSKGHVYYYHRRTMTRLPGDPGTTAFMDALRDLDVGQEVKANPGTLGALITAYRGSPEFARLADRTRSDYQKVFDYVKPLDLMPLVEIGGATLYGLRDKANAKHRRRFANYVVQVLRLLFNWGMRRGLVDRNPAVAVELVRRPRNAPLVNRPWSSAELETVLAEAPPELRIAISLGAYLGLREGDMLRVTWACYDQERVELRQQKTGESLWVPAHSRLREILESAPRVSPLIVIGARGRPFTQNGFQRRFFGLIRRLTEEGKVAPGLSFHGLRHMLGTSLAEAGCDPRTIAAILGQKTTAMADHYSRTADRRQLASAGMAKLERKETE
jgi:integrase